MSVISATAVSDWPTPTVSTRTTSWPAASTTSIASRVRRATPPRVPPAGEGRMKAFASPASRVMRVLSPRIEPPPSREEGSTASTASRWPRDRTCRPKLSMKVDLPTPGAPEMPMRIERPVRGSRISSSAVGEGAVVGPGRFHQGDGLGQSPAVALDQRLGQAGDVGKRRLAHDTAASCWASLSTAASCWRAHMAA